MGTIRQKINAFKLPAEQKLLRKYDIVDKSGALTDVGRRVVLDFIFEGTKNEEIAKKVVEYVEKVDAEENPAKK